MLHKQPKVKSFLGIIATYHFVVMDRQSHNYRFSMQKNSHFAEFSAL